jgi:hypothetical protein
MAAPVSVAPPSLVAQAAGGLGGLEAAKVEAIKAAIAAQFRFLSSLVEPVTRWVIDGGEMQLYFPAKDRALADMLQAREQLEKLRAISSQVLGQPLRICVRLESGAGTGAVDAGRRGSPALRAEIEQDPVVQAMLKRFGGQIRDVKDPEGK